MIKYACGCESKKIVMNKNTFPMSTYLMWAHSVGVFGTKEQCWECYNKMVKSNDTN